MSRTKHDRKGIKGYKIGEVSTMLDLPCSVLRFWESEFPHLEPFKTKGGQRLYSDDDIRKIRQIKTLLYEEKFTIPGAKKELARRGSEQPQAQQTLDNGQELRPSVQVTIARVRQALMELLGLMSEDGRDSDR